MFQEYGISLVGTVHIVVISFVCEWVVWLELCVLVERRRRRCVDASVDAVAVVMMTMR